MEVKKSQHKYVIGPKGNTLQEILDRTGVSVEIPPPDSSSETVILRGEPDRLGQALTEVYAKVNWLLLLSNLEIIGWIFEIVLANQKCKNFNTLNNFFYTVNIQANSYTVSHVTAPSWLHRFIIGKKGQNLAKITQQMPKVVH